MLQYAQVIRVYIATIQTAITIIFVYDLLHIIFSLINETEISFYRHSLLYTRVIIKRDTYRTRIYDIIFMVCHSTCNIQMAFITRS